MFFVPHKLYLHSVLQFFDHRQRLQHFIYIFRQMRSISGKFRIHSQRNPSHGSLNPLFGTTLKTSKELQHSKLTQFDCLFDAYATIISQYRAKFSGLNLGVKRYYSKLKCCFYLGHFVAMYPLSLTHSAQQRHK